MSFYFFYQQTPKSVWIPALADGRADLIRDKDPALCTVLDVDSTFDDDTPSEQFTTAKYRGPLYFDIDSEDIGVAIEQSKKLLVLIQSKGVNLNTVRCWLSGGRGVHIFIEQNTFMTKVPQTGTPNLPLIYKEMVVSTLFVDDVDCRVYSGKKGRMLRCPNFKRENGAYKVSVTANELLEMTPERYADLCSKPRSQVPVEAPTFCPELALAFSVAQDKVNRAVTKRKSKKQTSDELRKFGGNWPETLLLITQGLGLREDVGFNSVAMQVAITGCALGRTEDQIVAECEGLIETHKGDSARYGTAAKRRAFLREMVRYVDSNPMYEFSSGAIISLLDPSIKAASDIGLGDYVPDTPAETINQDGSVSEPEPEDATAPIKVTKGGVYVRSDTGYTQVCTVGIGKATGLKMMTGQDVGYEAEIFKDGKPLGTHVLSMDKLASRSAFQSFAFQWSASMAASDIQTARIADVLGKRAERNNDITYIVGREGVDLIVPAGAKSEDDFEIIWSSPTEVIGSKGGKYRFRNPLDKDGAFQSDLLRSKDLSLDDGDLIDALLHMNSTENLARLLGWFCVVPLTQIIRRFYKQFPILQVFGQAGAGKSKTTALLNHLWYFMKDPKELQAQGTTNYALLNVVASSASQPVIFEEVKAREMTKTLHDFLLNILRCNYDGFSISRGGLSKDSAARDVVVNSYGNVGPIAFVGESVENQSAILERCIIVSLSKADRYGRDMHYHYARKRATELGRIGKALMTTTMAIDIKKVQEDLDEIFEGVKKSVGPKAEEFERPVFNLACVSLGLKLLADTLQPIFGDKFDARIMEMRNSLTEETSEALPVNMSEASRVLDVMSMLTRDVDVQYQLIKNQDYTLSSDGLTMDLKLRTAYAKYIRWQRSLGQEALFDNENAFIAGMMNYAGTIKRACPDNESLFDSPRAIVYRLSCKYLENEGVDSFRG